MYVIIQKNVNSSNIAITEFNKFTGFCAGPSSSKLSYILLQLYYQITKFSITFNCEVIFRFNLMPAVQMELAGPFFVLYKKLLLSCIIKQSGIPTKINRIKNTV